jgi:hypothetical protein
MLMLFRVDHERCPWRCWAYLSVGRVSASFSVICHRSTRRSSPVLARSSASVRHSPPFFCAFFVSLFLSFARLLDRRAGQGRRRYDSSRLEGVFPLCVSLITFSLTFWGPVGTISEDELVGFGMEMLNFVVRHTRNLPLLVMFSLTDCLRLQSHNIPNGGGFGFGFYLGLKYL